MKPEEAAYILDHATTREALRPYLYDLERRIKVVEEACRVAAEALRGKVDHINREEWSGCDFCKKELDDYQYIAAHGDFSGSDTCYEPSYCPVCGRPLTEEAWAELEKRSMGCKMSEWISVKDRLPEDEKSVLAYYGFYRDDDDLGARFIGTLTYFCFDPKPHWQHESTGLFVTHWMPLPEPPKED